MKSLNDLYWQWRRDAEHSNAEAFTGRLHKKVQRLAEYDDDLTQQIMLAVYQNLERIDGDFTHWLNATAKRIKADHLRALIARRNDKAIPDSDDDLDALLNHDSLADIDFESLSRAEYDIARYIIEGYSLKEVAGFTGQSESAVYKRCERSRRRRTQK